MSIHTKVAVMLEKAAAISVVPKGRSAIKVTNYLKKHYGGKPHKNWSSNPYDSVQVMYCNITPARGEKFIKELISQGWAVKKTKRIGKDYKNSEFYSALDAETGARIDITQFSAKDVMSKKANCLVTAYGDKKAKASNLPYYD